VFFDVVEVIVIANK